MEKRKYTPEPVYKLTARLGYSSAISRIDYDDKNKIFQVHFRSGGKGRYRDVPYSIYTGIQTASSAGSYFHNYIKNVYQQY